MNEAGLRWYRYWRIARRKLNTVLKGPPRHPEFVKAAHYFADGWPLAGP
jgi:hypothetical protein